MKIYFTIVAVCLYFCLAQAENKTLEQTLAEGLHTNGLKELKNVTATIAQLEHDGYSHLTGILKHHVDTLKQFLAYVDTKFIGVNPIFFQNHLLDAIVVDMMFVEEQLSNEYVIVQQIIKDVEHKSNITQHELIEKAGYVIRSAKRALLLYENSREYSLIEHEIKDVQQFVAHLHNVTLNATQLNLQAQVLTQLGMSLEVLHDKAKWRLPCSLYCIPSNSSLLQLTDPIAVLNMVQILQNEEEIFKREINRSLNAQITLEKAGYYHLTGALDYQIKQKKFLLGNIQAQLAEDNQVFTQHYMQVLIEDSLRVDNRIKEETQIVDEVLTSSVTFRNETNHQALNRANLLVKLGKDFISKHEHLTEVPEIEHEVNDIQPLLGHLTVVNRSHPTEVNNKAEQQLDRHQKTLLHLMEQAVPK